MDHVKFHKYEARANLTPEARLLQTHWNQFFSRLAHAEKAAANQCAVIAEMFASQGQQELAKTYQDFSSEETNHFSLVSQVCKPLLDAPSAAQRIYDGELMNFTNNPIERMATIHLVFEPAALAFLGLFSLRAHDFIKDPKWANQIKKNFRKILKDEISHVYGGGRFIKTLLKTATPEEIALTKKAMRRHRTFVVAGIKAMFKSVPNADKFLQPMFKKFDAYQIKAMRGVFA